MSNRLPYRRSERCVSCGYPKSAHGSGGECVGGERGTFQTMNLPTGKTCADCAYLARPCSTIYGRIAEDESCDWSPVKFLDKRAAVQSPVLQQDSTKGAQGGQS